MRYTDTRASVANQILDYCPPIRHIMQYSKSKLSIPQSLQSSCIANTSSCSFKSKLTEFLCNLKQVQASILQVVQGYEEKTMFKNTTSYNEPQSHVTIH